MDVHHGVHAPGAMMLIKKQKFGPISFRSMKNLMKPMVDII
jgi:hypothetical protein